MTDFVLSVILGTELSEVKLSLDKFDELYLGLFISDLRMKDSKNPEKIKSDFTDKIKPPIDSINKKIKSFNDLLKSTHPSLKKIKLINFYAIKKIISEHNLNYAQSDSFMDEILGRADSPSSLARKHTVLRIRNVILFTRISIGDFVKSMDEYNKIFENIDMDKCRQKIRRELRKIRSIYSIGCSEEAIFLIGRLLETLVQEYMIILSKHKLINLKQNNIKDINFTFENKIDFLHSKKIGLLQDSMWSKMKSLKWDRNLYGHKINVKSKDAEAMIMLGLQSIYYIEMRIIKKSIK